MSRQSAAALLLALLCLCEAVGAQAVCTPERHFIYVGDTATDAQCNFDAIQDALDAVVCPNTWVVLTGEHTYTEQHLTVNTSLTLAGTIGVGCGNGAPPVCDPTIGCGAGGAPPQITIGGSSGNSVIRVVGAGYVFLYNLYITGGNAGSGGSGGGIYFTGSGGALTLNNTTIANNEAGFGGGIDMSPTGPATLTLQQYTLVISNTADTSGGGIRIENATRLFAIEPNTLIAFNQANGQSGNGYGGGIEVIAPAQADIGSSGLAAGGVVSNNFAEYGGGIAAVANGAVSDGTAMVRLFTTDPQNPVTVENNGASLEGGGIYLKPDTSIAELCAQDFVIDSNQAPDGAAIFADTYNDLGGVPGAVVALNTSPDSYSCDEPEPPTDLGAVACASGVPCNQIVGNINADTSGNPAIGSSIVFGAAGQGFLHRFSARQNQNTHLLNLASGTFESFEDHVELRNCLLTDNAGTAEMITTTDEGSADNFVLDSCTVANNLVGDAEYLIHIGGITTLQNSIIDQLSTLTLDFLGNPGNLYIHDILSNDISTLQGGSQLDQGAPTYVDAAHGNYHLTRTSLGVDYAPGAGGVDFDGHPRDIDLPDVPNQFGPRDLGAYEIQPSCSVADTIYCNGFDD